MEAAPKMNPVVRRACFKVFGLAEAIARCTGKAPKDRIRKVHVARTDGANKCMAPASRSRLRRLLVQRDGRRRSRARPGRGFFGI